MLRFIYWLIGFIMFAGIIALMIMEDDFYNSLINMTENIDNWKFNASGWLLVYQLVFAMMSICWPITLILFVILYLGYKESE